LCGKIDKYKRLSGCGELTKLVQQLLYRASNRLVFHEKKRCSNGGIMVAVVGADATGKTTIANELYQWLSNSFTTSLIHIGKPPSTALTFFVNIVVRITKFFKKKKNIRTSTQNGCSEISWPVAIRLLALAFDRMRLARRFWQKSINGDIVICDRYPSINIGVMDSQRMRPAKVKGLKKIPARWEQQFYKSIPTPDILFKLHIPVEVAIERNNLRTKTGKEDGEFIRLRHQENNHLNYRSGLIYTIDAN